MFRLVTANRGFTLIEIMVVISILSLVSSAIMVPLNSARVKAKDATAMRGALELKKLMELARSDYNSYANLQSGSTWYGKGGGGSAQKYLCSDIPSRLPLATTYHSQLMNICESLVDSYPSTPHPDYVIRMNATSGGTTDNYSIIVRLPSGRVFCTGSSGRTSIQAASSTALIEDTSQPGCPAAP